MIYYACVYKGNFILQVVILCKRGDVISIYCGWKVLLASIIKDALLSGELIYENRSLTNFQFSPQHLKNISLTNKHLLHHKYIMSERNSY